MRQKQRLRKQLRSPECLELRQLLAADPIISEFMADNGSTLLDGDGQSSDWIELQNRGDTAVNLEGWYLTDNASNLTKWRFPSVTLDAGAFFVVFASGQDVDNYVDPGGNLHTNFGLSANGEYLGLVEPDGSTIRYEFRPEYPEQLRDISYGLQIDAAVSQPLVREGDSARLLIPNSSIDAWTEVAYGDSSWVDVSTGVGFENRDGITLPDGLQTFFGFDDAASSSTALESVTNAPVDITGASTFVAGQYEGALVFDGTTSIDLSSQPDGMRDGFTMAMWMQPTENNRTLISGLSASGGYWLGYNQGGPWLRIAAGAGAAPGSSGTFVNATATGAMSTLGQWYHLTVTFDPADTDEEVKFYVNGQKLTSGVSAADLPNGLMGDNAGTAMRIGVHNSGAAPFVGLMDEVAIYDRPITETEVLGIMNDGVIGGGPAYDEVIATNIEGSMYQVNATAYLRQTFAVEDTSQFDTLTLRVRYNDGFVAYLNGTEIARQNAPALPQWNSSATTTRVPEASAAFQDFNISQHLGLLSTTSANVLAIQGLNTSADDATFLLAPELIAAATSEELRYLDTPTPGAANTGGLEGLVGDTRFSVDRGFYEGPIDVAISTSTAGAEIRYTLDGSTPSATRGNLYTDPIHIDETTTLRAIAYKEGLISTNVDTHTYVYLADVVRQPALPAGLPSTWNNYSIGPTGTAVPADYAMDQRIVDNAAYSMDLIDGLRSIPTLSLVMEQDDWFASTQGIYVNPFSQGEGWEREVSAEWIDPQGGDEFQVNAGIRVFGGYSRHFWATPKKSFSLRFRGEYGTPRLDFPMFSDSDVDSFDLVVLRAVFSDAWPDAANPPQYLRDLYARQTQLAMGQPSSHGTWVHLYINGLYWGIYNPSERPDADYAADYFGGDETEWDAIKHGGLLGPGQVQNNTFEVVDGDSVVWQQTLALARSGLADADRYAQFTQLVDVENLADYIIVNTYLSNVDWPHKNWWANRKRDESGRWRFYNWDSEYTLNDVNTNRTGVNNTNTPAELYAAARANPEFRLLFADRVHQHLFNDGALRPEVNMERYAELAGVIEDPIVAESARWGDNGATRQGATFYTRNGSWRPTRDSLLDPENGYFARRHAIALSHYVSAGLYPSVDAAEYSQHGGHVPVDYPLTMDAPAGAIYYTLDGSDPRQGEVTVETTELLGVGAPVRLVVPTSDIGTAWRQRVFDDADWQSGSTGLGYDDSPDYDPFIGTDIESLLNPDGAGDNEYNSVYMRVPFEVEDPAAFNVLNLLMQYDDGFVAYLNGSRVALANAPVFPLWNSVALADHPDAEATAFQTFDISAFRSLLVPGTNVLAIQGLNTSGSSSDMLVTPRIEAGVASSVGISPSAMLYTGQVSLTENVNVKARVLQGSVWSALNQATFFVDRPTPLRVTEINFNPEGSDSSEFLEIQNTGDEPVELQGLHFGKGVEFVFPDIELAPGGYVVVVANQTAFAAKYDTSGIQIAGEFLSGALDNGGEGLSLVDPLGAVLLDFSYDDDWFPLADGLGFTLVLADTAADVQTLDTKNAWRPSGMIDGSPGAADSPTAPPPGAITISELVANPSDVGQDWVELFNTTDTALDLSGWYVSDDPRVPQKAQLPAETTVPAHGYLVLDEASYFGTMGSPNHVSLPADGGQFSLVAGTLAGQLLGFQEVQGFDAVDTIISEGVYTTSEGKSNFVLLQSPTPGQVNASPVVSPVVINEVMYHPVDEGDEFIELYNWSSNDVLLHAAGQPDATWYLDDAVEYVFPAGMSLPAGGYLLVSSIDPAAFRTKYGINASIPIVGPFAGALSNDGESVELYRPSELSTQQVGILVDRVNYNDAAPWPTQADGFGASLERIAGNRYGNDPVHWMQSAAGGSPGTLNLGIDTSPPSTPRDVVVQFDSQHRVQLDWSAAIDSQSGIAEYQVYRDGALIGRLPSSITTFTDTAPATGASLSYRVAAINGDGIQGAPSIPVTVSRWQNGTSPDGDYVGSEDTQLAEQTPNTNLGAATTLIVDVDEPDESGLQAVGLLRWDLATITSGVQLQSASVALQVRGATGVVYDLYEATRPWVETEATWNQYANGQPWQTPGASGDSDRGDIVLGSIGPAGGGPSSIVLNDNGLAVVQDWVDGARANYGFVLVPSTDITGGGDPTILEDLIAFYDFEELVGGQAVDLSGNGLHATASNVSVRPDGFNGNAFDFNGSAHVVAPIDINVGPRPQFTMGAWVKANAVGSGLYKILGHDNGGWDRTVGLDNRGSGDFRWTAFIGNGNPIPNTPPPAFDQWTFIAATYNNAANTMTLYVDLDANSTDEAPLAFTAATGFNTGWTTVSIGSLRPDNFSEAFTGAMDNVFFFGAELSAETIRQIRNAGAGYFLESGLTLDSSESPTASNRPKLSVSFVNPAFGDLTGDRQVNANDIDRLWQAVGASEMEGRFDLDGSGTVDESDVRYLVQDILQTLPGDANLDGLVNATDFNTWNSQRFQSNRGWAQGDFDGDGVVDVQDFNVWNQFKFQKLPVASSQRSVTGEPRSPLS